MLTDILQSYVDLPNNIASQKPRLGRLVSIDPRDHKFPMRAARPVGRAKTWGSTTVLDQGNTSQCVAYSWSGLLIAGPVTNRKNLPTPQSIYDAAQKVDEWEGEGYEGTSVRAGAQVLQSLGYLSGYVWAHEASVVASYVINTAPVVFGTDWLEGMFETDEKGFVRATGDPAGGHAYLIIGANLDKKCPDGSVGALRILNSWGRTWGEAGRAWLSFPDADKLLKGWGEACSPAEVKRRI